MKYRYVPVECNTFIGVKPCYVVPSETEFHKYNFKMLVSRLITGNLDVKCNSTGKIIKQRIDFSVLGGRKSVRPKLGSIHTSFGIDKDLFESYVSTPDVKNRAFYEDLFWKFQDGCG